MAETLIVEDDHERSKFIQYDVDTEVHIKLITKRELREIGRKAAKHARLTGEDEADVSDRLLGRAVVLGWRKIADHNHPGLTVDKQPLPVCQKNIDMLMTKSLKFSRFVNQTCIDEDEFTRETEIKND
ncbi:MAG: hypothetical protein HZB61_10365 [Nitrospirae bacterium]|nr:hypothetical protein [Nitrospirota bacterium]